MVNMDLIDIHMKANSFIHRYEITILTSLKMNGILLAHDSVDLPWVQIFAKHLMYWKSNYFNFITNKAL